MFLTAGLYLSMLYTCEFKAFFIKPCVILICACFKKKRQDILSADSLLLQAGCGHHYTAIIRWHIRTCCRNSSGKMRQGLSLKSLFTMGLGSLLLTDHQSWSWLINMERKATFHPFAQDDDILVLNYSYNKNGNDDNCVGTWHLTV